MKNHDRTIQLLLVEDDDLSREVLTLQIAAEGYGVNSVDSGDAALRYLQQTPKPLLDVVLTDLQMPGVSGPELARQLRLAAIETGSPGLVLLAMSAGEPPDAIAGLFDGFLLKPFTVNQLQAALTSSSALTSADATPSLDAKDLADAKDLTGELCPSLDESIYERFAAGMPAAQLQQLYALCLDDAALRIARMRHAANAGDDLDYRREAHAIKGGCSMVGAVELHRLAAAAEDRGVDSANHVASLDQMMIAWERLHRILYARENRPPQ
jgi:CheY-like chemotaxis protein/HPt (histidine-containing phosphotransfer) domain-containing protein